MWPEAPPFPACCCCNWYSKCTFCLFALSSCLLRSVTCLLICSTCICRACSAAVLGLGFWERGGRGKEGEERGKEGEERGKEGEERGKEGEERWEEGEERGGKRSGRKEVKERGGKRISMILPVVYYFSPYSHTHNTPTTLSHPQHNTPTTLPILSLSSASSACKLVILSW